MEEQQSTLETLLRENIAIAKENNEILKDMRRIGRIAFWAKVVIWTLVLILPLLLIGPLLNLLGSTFAPEGASSVMGLPSAQMLEEALEVYSGQ